MTIIAQSSKRILFTAALLTLAATCYVSTAFAAKITVTHWGAQFYGAPYAVAMAKGYFKDEGVDIDGFYSSTGVAPQCAIP